MIRICESWLWSASVDICIFIESTSKVREVKQLAQDIEKKENKSHRIPPKELGVKSNL